MTLDHSPRATMPVRRTIHSQSQIEQFRTILERKTSMSRILQQTAENLSNSFCRGDTRGPEDIIYDLFKIANKEEASVGKLLMVLRSYGLHRSDPRLRPMMQKVWEIEKRSEAADNEAMDPKHWKLGKDDFVACVTESLAIITRTIQNTLVIQSWQQLTSIIQEIYEQCVKVSDGKVATYIPQLARVDPKKWGVSICTIDGQRCSFGNAKEAFCFQSVSKVFNYAIAASDLGSDLIHSYVGQEPSGRLFNEICLDGKNKPHNPMINSGAIIVSSLIQNQLELADRFDYILERYKRIAGEQHIGFNNAVFLSERRSAARNFARNGQRLPRYIFTDLAGSSHHCALVAHYMKEYNCFPSETTSLMDALDFYFQLCSLEGTCDSMAVMAATLANGGVCPLTEERCIESRPCRDVLSLMYSCGMYDYSGQFAFHVGLPAKSGVSGGMIVVVPNVMGICLWAPPLDAMGNSCRGVAFCKELIERFNFHNYDSLAHNEEGCKYDPRKRFGEVERDQVVSLLFAAKTGDLNTIRRIYMQGGDLEMSDYDKRTALHLAASEGQMETVRFLVNTGRVSVTPRDRWLRIPRDDARTFGYPLIEAFLDRAQRAYAAGISPDRDGEKTPTVLGSPPSHVTFARLSSISSEPEEGDDQKEPKAEFTARETNKLVSSRA